MKALIAEDNPTTRLLLEMTLTDWGYEIIAAANGAEAWEKLRNGSAPGLVLLDWAMPVLDGLEVCRRVREAQRQDHPYVIMITGKGSKQEIVAGLEAGANDYITKPFDPAELKARIEVGVRMLELQRALSERVRELEQAMARVKQLHGLLPICGYCKRIRNDQNYWQQLEGYISSHADVSFSHSVCPECYETRIKPELEAITSLQDTD